MREFATSGLSKAGQFLEIADDSRGFLPARCLIVRPRPVIPYISQ